MLSGVVAAGFFGVEGEVLTEKGRKDMHFVAKVTSLLVLQKPSKRKKKLNVGFINLL